VMSHQKLSHISLFCFGEEPETRLDCCGFHSRRFGLRVVL
jgi:hypothetical protein